MTSARVHTEATTVILLGSFNPRIFEPRWFSDNELVSKAEADDAEFQMIDREFAHMRLDWVDFVAVEKRLQVNTTSETVSDGQIRDLLSSLLKLLPHTPIQLGSIHHRAEVAIDTEEAWHQVGHTLAPKEPWEGVLDKPGMFDFAMQGVRPDDLQGAIKVRIQPSQVIQPGIFINVNDEFVILERDGAHAPVADILEGLWPDAESRAKHIRSRLLDRLVP